jgi:hypothetical protein
VAGILFYTIIGQKNNTPKEVQKPFTVYILTGLMVLTGIGQWLVLFVPLSIKVFLVMAVLLIAGCFFYKRRLQQVLQHTWTQAGKKLAGFTALGACCFMILVLNAGPVMMDDTESYHIQLVKWTQEYGTVPGLANLHLRFGFNSSWFTSISLLSPSFTGINHYLSLNGLLSCWACLYFVEQLLAASSGRSTHPSQHILAVILVLIFSLLIWPMVRGNATTANYDFITTLCILVLFMETAFTERFTYRAEWILWPCYLFTVRIINYPLLLLALFALWPLLKQKQWKQVVAYMVFGALLVLPFLARNVLLSGYLLFPSMVFGAFPVDWKTDSQMMTNILDYIKYFNRVNSMYQSIGKTHLLSFPHWTQGWYTYLQRFDKILLIVSLAAGLFCMFRWKYLKSRLGPQSLQFMVVLLALLVSWFIVAPDPRFVYGALLSLIVAACVALPPLSGKRIVRYSAVLTVVLIPATCFVYATAKMYTRADNYRNYTIPRSLPTPPVKQVMVDGIVLNIPEKILGNWNARCYGTPLPCLYRVHPALRARGKTMAEGFYLDKNVQALFDAGAWY